jgi:ribosomal protein S18 acetylase RimI-like enzyme
MVDVREMIIRPLRAEDLPRVGELAGQLVRMHHATDPDRFFRIPNVEKGYAWYFRSQLRDRNTVMLVAEERGRVIGYAYGCAEPRDWNLLLDDHGAIHDVLVDRACRRKGTGRALVEEMLRVFGERGLERVVLSTMVGNKSAQKLFLSVGFRPTMTEMTWNKKTSRSTASRRSARSTRGRSRS